LAGGAGVAGVGVGVCCGARWAATNIHTVTPSRRQVTNFFISP
jgi:hypothetical protein